MKIDTKRIGLFLKSMDGAEYRYLCLSMQFRASLESLIKEHNLSKEEICQRFKIKLAKYNDYVKGNYNYSLIDMASLNASHMELGIKKLEENPPFKVASKDKTVKS